MLKFPALLNTGFQLTYFPLGDEIRNLVKDKNWKTLDEEFKKLTAPDGRLFQFLSTYHDFQNIEFIISIRDSENEWEEDGVWHDDGSRVFAFSLSLTEDAGSIEGGRLGIKRRGSDEVTFIPTPEFGGMILFLTGIYGFEHCIHQVTKGQRIIIAGWCS